MLIDRTELAPRAQPTSVLGTLVHLRALAVLSGGAIDLDGGERLARDVTLYKREP